MSIRERPTKADLGYVPVGSAIWFLSADASRHGTRHKRTEDAVPATGKAFVGGSPMLAAKRTSAGAVATWSRTLLADQDGTALLLDLREL